MKRIYITTAIVSAVLLVSLVAIGYLLVPDVGDHKNHTFTNNFLFNGYLIFLGFLATSAVVGPLTATFLEWRIDNDWKGARIIALTRIHSSLNSALSDYRAFIMCAAADDDNNASTFLGIVIKHLRALLEIYDNERATFNAEMHSAGSVIRGAASSLLNALATMELFSRERSSLRIFIGRDAIEKLRAICDGRAVSEIDEAALPNAGEHPILRRDPYFTEHGRLFIDLAVDRLLGAGVTDLDKFRSLDMEELRRTWIMLVKACAGTKPNQFALFSERNDGVDTAQQESAYNKYVDKHVEESVIRARLRVEAIDAH